MRHPLLHLRLPHPPRPLRYRLPLQYQLRFLPLYPLPCLLRCLSQCLLRCLSQCLRRYPMQSRPLYLKQYQLRFLRQFPLRHWCH